MRRYTKIKVIKVCFIPTWWELDKEGNVLAKRTTVGQLAIRNLPQGMRDSLEKYIMDALTSHEHKF